VLDRRLPGGSGPAELLGSRLLRRGKLPVPFRT
jgi:hypothetical protein